MLPSLQPTVITDCTVVAELHRTHRHRKVNSLDVKTPHHGNHTAPERIPSWQKVPEESRRDGDRALEARSEVDLGSSIHQLTSINKNIKAISGLPDHIELKGIRRQQTPY